MTNADHPLIGTWVGEGEDSRCHYTIKSSGTSFTVTAIDAIDGEELIISDVDWDGENLTFTSLMPSTGRIGKNVMHLITNNDVEFQFTFTVTETWHKIKQSNEAGRS